MKQLISITMFAFAVCTCIKGNAQDKIITYNQDTINCKVMEIQETSLKYKYANEDVINSISKNIVHKVVFASGREQVITVTKTDTVYITITKPESLSSIAKSDADKHYRKCGGGRTVTILTTALFGPLTGLAPAIMCSTIPIAKKNLRIPNPELMDNEEYYRAYKREARHIKARKVWRSFRVGTLIFFTIVGGAIALAATNP